MFGGGQKRGRNSRNGGEMQGSKGADIAINLDVDFMEAVQGTKKTISFNRTDTCPTCKGTKCKPGTSASSCGGCGGQGF